MRGLAPKLLATAATLAASLALAAPALAAPAFGEMFPFSGSLDASNNKIVAGPDGNMWFTVNTAGKDVARITPAGVITEFDLPNLEAPIGIAPGAEGLLWTTATGKATSFSPANPEGSAKTFESAAINSGGQIVAGPGGEIWVASLNALAHFSPADPGGTLKPIAVTELSPKDIDVAGSLVVIADAGHKRLVTATAAGLGPEIPLLGETTTAQGVAGNPNGQIVFSKSDQTEGLGLVTPPAAPTAALMMGDPFGVALGADGAYYFAMSAAHGAERLTPDGNATEIPFPGLDKWFPRQIAAGPGNTMWVTMEIPGENKYAIARITGVEPPAPPTPPTPPSGMAPQPGPVPAGPSPAPLPQTALGKLPKKVVKTTAETATVKFSFSSTSAGAGFECSLGRRVKPKGKKARFVGQAFKGCKSPKSYRLKPGRYRFQVRAVTGGLRDASPASFGFKVIQVRGR